MTGLHLQPVTQRRLIALFILLLFVLFGVFIPIDHNVSAFVRLEPESSWTVFQDGSGYIKTGWKRNSLGNSGTSKLYQFERPDIVEIDLRKELSDGQLIHAGDTLGVIWSRDGQGRSEVTLAEIELEIARREAIVAGGRPEDIKVSKQKLEKSRVEFESYEIELNRVTALFDSNLVSQARYQEVKSRYDILGADMALEESRFNAMVAGGRDEDVAVAEAEIERLRRLSENVKSTLGTKEYIITPTNGYLKLYSTPEEMIIVERADTLMARIIVSDVYYNALSRVDHVELDLNITELDLISAKIEKIGFFGADTMAAYGIAYIDNSAGLLSVGVSGNAVLPIGRQTLFDRMKTAIIQ
jgi:hypothetical protein